MIFDVPRINTTVRNSLVATNSTVIYNTDNNQYEYYNGTSWKPFGEGGVISFNTRTGNVVLLDSDIAGLGDFTVSGTLTINNDIILGSELLKIMTASVDPNVSGVAASVGSLILRNDGSLWQKLDTGNKDWSQIQLGEFTNEPTGFPVGTDGQVDRTSSIISFSNTSPARTFSISPAGSSFTILIKGRQYRKTTTETIQISASEGIHYIYYDESGVLSELTSFSSDLILKDVLVAVIYWDSTNNQAILVGDERHGCTMDSHTHARIHSETGAVYVSGMALNNFTVNGDGTSESHLTYSASSGTFRDEDILHSLVSKNTNNPIPIFYRDGTSNWRSITPSISGGTYARAIGTPATPGQIAYNQLSGGSWTRTTVPNTYFVCYHIVASNDINNPFFIIMGNAAYQTKPEAKTAAITEISNLGGLPFTETVFIGTILFESRTSYSNSLKAAIVNTDGSNYVDWRFKTTLNPSTANVNTHNNLGGIYGASPYYHSDQPIATTNTVQFAGLNIAGNYSFPQVDGTSGQVMATNGSGTLSFTSITQNHNSLTGIQGGGGGNYYHSNQPINTTDSVQFGGLTVLGNLTVSGTTTTVNSTTLQIQDKNIELGKVTSPSDILADGGGITLLGNSNKTFNWVNSTESWTSSEHLDLASGKVYKINGSTVLSATQIFGKNVPTGDIVGTTDNQTLTTKTLQGFKLTGDIDSTLYAADFDLIDNVTSALSFDSVGKLGILEIDTVDGSEKVKMSGGLSVTGTSVLANLTASGTLNLNGLIYPSTDGTNGQVLTTNGSGTLSFTTVTQNHNSLTGLQGGGSSNYYHSNQPINTTSNVTFNNLSVVSGVNATGTVRFNNIRYPSTDGTPDQILKTDGSGNLSFVSLPGASSSVLDTYLNSQKITIANSETSTIQTIFTETVTGIYHFWVSADPRIKGTLIINSSDITNSVLETTSATVTGLQNNASTLNVYSSGGNIVFQNNTGSSIILVIRRETTPAVGGSTGASTLTIGTGLSGGSYNGTTNVTIAIDSSVVTLTGSQALSNKTLTSPILNGGSLGGNFDISGYSFTGGTLAGNKLFLDGATGLSIKSLRDGTILLQTSTDGGSTSKAWTFNSGGNLVFPDGTTQGTGWSPSRTENLTNKTLISPTITAPIVTGSTKMGSNTFTKNLSNGDIALDNGSVDTPGVIFYHGNNVNYGIDTFYDANGQRLRFVKNINEVGGAELGYFDTNGNFTVFGYLNPTTFKAGQVIKDTMLSNTEVTVVSTTIAATNSNVDFITYNYTPVSSSSYLIVHIHISKYYQPDVASGNEAWYSVLKVAGNEIAYGYQKTVNAFRTGTLFPLTGRYTNMNTTTKTIAVAARQDTSDDYFIIDNTSTSIWLRITEVAR